MALFRPDPAAPGANRASASSFPDRDFGASMDIRRRSGWMTTRLRWTKNLKEARMFKKLTISYVGDMVFPMKTTYNINDGLMVCLLKESVRQGKTITEFVESALSLKKTRQ